MKREEKKYKKGARVNVKLPEWDKPYKGVIKSTKNGKFNIKLDDDEDGEEFEEIKKVKRQYIDLIPEEEINEEKIMSELKELMEIRKTKGKKSMMEQLEKICKVQEKYDKKKREREDKKKQTENVSKFRKLLREKNIMNDFKYFRTMPVETQEKIIAQLEEVNKFTTVEKPYRLALLESDIPVEFKAKALKKINMLNFMDPGTGEYYKIKQWVDTFMRIPFGVHRTLPVRLEDGQDKYNEFMESSKKTLDEAVYGLDDEQLGWIKNNGGVVHVVALGSYLKAEKQKNYRKGLDSIIKLKSEVIGFKTMSYSDVMKLPEDDMNSYRETYTEIQKLAKEEIKKIKSKYPPVDVSDFVDHIDYIKDKIGIDHVGISSDFDGGGGIDGWEDASETFNVTLELVKRGYSEGEIAKIWSGNLLRVLDKNQEIAIQLQNTD